MNGWENAKARVTAGGVAARSGDFRWTMIVERGLAFAVVVAGEELGGKAAIVGEL